MMSYINGVGSDVPLLLLGNAGSGKSSIMAKVADMISTAAMHGSIKGWVSFVDLYILKVILPSYSIKKLFYHQYEGQLSPLYTFS